MSEQHQDLTSTGTLSLALLGLLLAQPCYRGDATIEVQTDGSGTFTTEASVDSVLMASIQTDQEADTEELGLDDDYLKKARAFADTTPGFYFDTAFPVQNPDRSGFRARFHFDSIEMLGKMGLAQEDDETVVSVLEQSGRQLRVNFRPTSSMDFGLDSENRVEQLGRRLAPAMIDYRFRVLLPVGTEVDSASPSVRRSDSTVVWEWGLKELKKASEEEDSLYVTARLPSAGPNLTFWFGAVLVVGPLLAGLVLLRKRSG